jgi:hypothetical protein
VFFLVEHPANSNITKALKPIASIEYVDLNFN